MSDETIKTALSYSLGADLHENWCDQELKAFYERFQNELATASSYEEALQKACYKGKDKRNEVIINTNYFTENNINVPLAMRDYTEFKKLVDAGIINVKRFTKRNLTPEEIARMGNDYVDGKENILRKFSEISTSSQEDNLEAAKVAINDVYDKTIAGEPFTSEEIEEMGAHIHNEWLKRNSWVFDPNYGNPSLAVPYDKLSREEQDKDKAQIGPAQIKIQAYMNGLIDIESLCEEYGIEASTTRF